MTRTPQIVLSLLSLSLLMGADESGCRPLSPAECTVVVTAAVSEDPAVDVVGLLAYHKECTILLPYPVCVKLRSQVARLPLKVVADLQKAMRSHPECSIQEQIEQRMQVLSAPPSEQAKLERERRWACDGEACRETCTCPDPREARSSAVLARELDACHTRCTTCCREHKIRPCNVP